MRIKKYWKLLIILGCTTLVYSLSLKNGFVNLDDPLLITENTYVLTPGLRSIWHVFTHFDPELYIPVTFLSYQLESWTLGMDAWHFHLINVLLHLGSIVLVYLIVQKITKRETVAIITAALFALHPINSEAVLWVSARKDLLSAFFFLCALTTYLQYKEKGASKWYWGSLGLFLLALGSKVSAVTLPVVLLFLQSPHPRRGAAGVELKSRTDIARTGKPMLREMITDTKKLIPFFLLSLLFGLIAIAGKEVVESALDAQALLFMAFRSTLFYLQLLLVPINLAAVHAVPDQVLLSPLVPVAVILIVSVSFGLWKARKHLAHAWFGWTLFLVTLAPTFLHYTRGNESLMLGSERYMYLPTVGIFLIVGVLFHRLLTATFVSKPTRIFVASSGVFLLVVFTVLTGIRTFIFEDSIIFNIDIIQKHPEDARAYHNLGLALEEARRPAEAEFAYTEAMKLEPTLLDPPIALGILLMKEGRKEEATLMFTLSTERRSDSFKGFYNLGVAQQKLENFSEAAKAYEESIERFPDHPDAHRNLATVYGALKRFDKAIREYEILAELDPSFREEFEKMKGSVK